MNLIGLNSVKLKKGYAKWQVEKHGILSGMIVW